MMLQRANVVKVVMMGLMLVNCSMQATTGVSSKKINYGNAIKATMLSMTSALGAWIYYVTIIEPEIINRAKKEGLNYAIQFNKVFVLHNPELALLFATPLFLAAFHAVLARDYFKQIWQDVEVAQEETEQEVVNQEN